MFRVRARVIVVTRRTLAMNPHGLTKIMASFAVIVKCWSTTLKRRKKSCNGYCQALGLACAGAWEEVDDTCTVEESQRCDEETGSGDAICECEARAIVCMFSYLSGNHSGQSGNSFSSPEAGVQITNYSGKTI